MAFSIASFRDPALGEPWSEHRRAADATPRALWASPVVLSQGRSPGLGAGRALVCGLARSAFTLVGLGLID